MSDTLPADLGGLSGIAKQKIADLRRDYVYRHNLGLVSSHDRPERDMFSRVIPAVSFLRILNDEARRRLGPQAAPREQP